ncbi:ADP-ribosylglycohydrolase family protein [Paenibacillus daejeonensis]|uniref:ADP-ribosylglycohydrolase family protein n=1 Tax=Paenibacillus daejeonensis TaxID=135193 RepID=UPI000374D1BE|nr:ADP-ribosylglycohydrolase family protein [Paenibacillus daejeonensis]
MRTTILNEKDYYRRVYGGWLGKNIGGTLGAPVEGKKELLQLDFYPVLQDGPLENDDLDLQLVWLHALEQYGPGLTSRELGQEWLEHIFFPFDEYGYALTNLRKGLIAPLTGSFNNPFADCMGSPIRSEIWAMTAPAAPHVAAYYAYQDAVVDHAGGEGVYGEMLFAAIESAIFMEQDRDRLIDIGLSYLPPASRTAKAVQDLLKWHREGKDWIEARSLILEHHGHDNFTDAPQNIAFTLLGWLYGTSFEDAILKAVNCGYDTDCTAATLGAILGMISGPEGLPERWVAPVGDRVVVSPPIKGFPAPADLDELTMRTIRMGKQVLAAWDTGILVHPELETDMNALTAVSSEAVRELWDLDVTADHRLLPSGSLHRTGLELIIDYGSGRPAIARREHKSLVLTLVNHSQIQMHGQLSLEVPPQWACEGSPSFQLNPGESCSFTFQLVSGPDVTSTYELNAVIARTHDHSPWSQMKERFVLVPAAEWTVWGPMGEQGKPASFGGNRIEWEAIYPDSADGVYRATTQVHNPRARELRLLAAANGPVKVRLNGKQVIDCPEPPSFMPAYHRTPESQLVQLLLPEGTHELEVIAERRGEPLLVYLLPVATKVTSEPGSCYYMTDILLYPAD